MNPKVFKEKLEQLSAITKKVFEVVPIQGPQNAAWIANALKRATSSTPDPSIVRGCLNTLKESGLIREPAPGCFQRDPTPEPGTTVTLNAKGLVPVESAPRDPEVHVVAERSPLDRMADAAAQLRTHATALLSVAETIEGIALEFEASRETDADEVKKLRRLQTLLKELSSPPG